MKIKWRKITSRIADGYVGKIRCFEIEKSDKGVFLTCELPSVNDQLYGRSIVPCSSTKEAAKAAELTFKHWIGRLRDE